MNYKNENCNNQEKVCAENTFTSLLSKKDNNILRDTYILIKQDDTNSGKLEAGFTAVYPGCSTKGHEHSDFEEIYFITKGKGVAKINKENFYVFICYVFAGIFMVFSHNKSFVIFDF